MEQDTVGLTKKKEWLFCKKGKKETYRAHRILTRQHNSEPLAEEILFSKEDLPQLLKENMKHEKT